MTIYDIDNSIYELFDEEGELTDTAEFDRLQMERTGKIENLACYYKNVTAEADAIRQEIASLQKRKKTLDARADRIKNVLEHALCGEKFESPRVTVSYRESKRCVLDDEFIPWAEENCLTGFVRYKPEPDKAAIAEAINAGMPLEHAQIETVKNMQVR